MAKRRNPNMGRPSVFRDKRGGRRVQGLITRVGRDWFESRREELAALCGREPKQVTDADVIEFMARGATNTRDYLAGIAK